MGNETYMRRQIIKRMVNGGIIITGIGTTNSVGAQVSDNNTTHVERSPDIEPAGLADVDLDCIESNRDKPAANIQIDCAGKWNIYLNTTDYAKGVLMKVPELSECRSRSGIASEIESSISGDNTNNKYITINCNK